jgi:hypothetical protein
MKIIGLDLGVVNPAAASLWLMAVVSNTVRRK